jgi:hypothetical protein
MLLAHEQTTPGMTLYVEPGVFYIGITRVIFTGGNSPAFTAPVSNPRIDILTIDNTGTLAITQGTENASPSAPSYPANKVVICEVYHVVGETALYDNDSQVAGQGYILNDVRPLATPPYISSTSQFGSAVVPDSALVSTFIHDPGSDAQGDLIYFNGSAWARLPAGTSGQLLKTQGAGANPAWTSVAVANVSGSDTQSFTATTTAQYTDVTYTHNLNRTPALIILSMQLAPQNNPSSGSVQQTGITIYNASGMVVGGFTVAFQIGNGSWSPSILTFSGGGFSVTGTGSTAAITESASIVSVTTTTIVVRYSYQLTTGSGTLTAFFNNIAWSVIG